MASKLGYKFLDQSGENSRVEFNVPDVGAGNIVGILATADQDTAGGLGESLAALSLCTMLQHDLNVGVIADNAGVPASPYAQREIGMMVTYQDTTTNQLYRVTIPGPNLANLAVAGSDQVNMTHASFVAFRTAFEAQCVSPDDNPVTIVSARIVGRSR